MYFLDYVESFALLVNDYSNKIYFHDFGTHFFYLIFIEHLPCTKGDSV